MYDCVSWSVNYHYAGSRFDNESLNVLDCSMILIPQKQLGDEYLSKSNFDVAQNLKLYILRSQPKPEYLYL